MLNENSIAVVADTASMLAEKRIHVTPLPETPLSDLVRLCTKSASVVATVGTNGAETVPSFGDTLVTDSNEPDATGVSNFGDTFEAAVKAVVGAVNFNNQLARNTVNPMIERVTSKIDSALDSLSNSASMPIEIQSLEAPALWSHPYIGEVFSRYEETTYSDILYNGPAVAYDDALLVTGAASFDEAIAQYAQYLASTGQLATIWNKIFGKGPFRTSEALAGTDPFETIDTGIVLYLAANTLETMPPAETNMSLAAWESMVKSIKTQAGRVVYRGLGRLNGERTRRHLIRSYPAQLVEGNKIVVDGPVYNQFISDGGSPEVLLGALYSDRNASYSTLISNKDMYAEKWRVVQAALASAASGRRLQTAIVALEEAVAYEINNLDEDLMLTSRSHMHAMLHQRLKLIGSRSLEDIWDLARKTICRTIFPHTDAEATLMAIDEQKRRRPDLDLREAALYASFDQLAQWLAKLIKVELVGA